MSNIIPVPFGNGYVSTGTGARDASTLESGELATMEAAYYRKNDPTQVWKMPGRALFGSAGSTIVKGIAICQFDEGGTDRLLASIGTTVVAATPGASGTFSSLITGLDSSATRFTACHQDDRWYLGNGYDANRTLKSDGTVRLMGMQKPLLQPTVSSASSAEVTTRPFANTGTWTTPTLAIDSDVTTFSSATAVASSFIHTWSAWASDTTANRTLKIPWKIDVPQPGLSVHILIEKSEDQGASWTTLISQYPLFNVSVNEFSGLVTANSNLIQVRATLTVNLGYATAIIYDIKIVVGSPESNFSTMAGGGVRYAFAEYCSTDDLLSPLSEPSPLTQFSSINQATITRPTATNPSATHWYVYRVGDGVANTLDNYGQVSGPIAIADATWIDRFEILITESGTPIIPLVQVGDLIYPRDDPPPPFLNMISWKGSICGISRLDRRSWFFSDGGRPESFPKAYVVSSFPLDEHDGLVGQMAVGETLVLLCEGAVLAMDEIPRVTDGQFNDVNVRPIKGHPGCVGEYAYTTFSVAGEPRGAWVSPFGVYVTNGQVCACISTDLAWESEVNVSYLSTAVLRWDQKNLILWFEFDLDGGGLNDHEMPFHMAQMHSKGEARPKLGQPTAKASSCMTSALIASTHYRFSGHPSNGAVYVEESGTTDAATGSAIEMVVKTGQIGSQKVDLTIAKATVNHSDFGDGETCTLVATLYRDSANTENSRSQSVRLDGNRGTTVGIGRGGELVDLEVTYSGSGTGGISGIDLEVTGQGRSGSASRWATSSATP